MCSFFTFTHTHSWRTHTESENSKGILPSCLCCHSAEWETTAPLPQVSRFQLDSEPLCVLNFAFHSLSLFFFWMSVCARMQRLPYIYCLRRSQLHINKPNKTSGLQNPIKLHPASAVSLLCFPSTIF